jgi:DNA mismatch repair protein MutL
VQLFCGRRALRDRGLLHAVVMGYGELVPHGRYPTAVVFVDPPPGSVDVNVHPQKVEVRFARPQEVYAAVRHGVAAALARAPWLVEQRTTPSVSMYAVASHAPPTAQISEMAASYGDRQERLLTGLHSWKPAAHSARLPSEPRPPTSEAGFFGNLAYLGQLDLTYLVCAASSPGELVLVDQHAAHERIAFQRLRAAHEATGVRTQRLLFPRTIELSTAQAAAASDNRNALESIGFELEPFGGARWALKASPAELRDDEVLPALFDLLSDLADAEASKAVGDRIDHMLATIACHSVVRAGDALSPDEAIALLSSLDSVDFRGHCPHGRPVLLRLGVTEIARRFGRT